MSCVRGGRNISLTGWAIRKRHCNVRKTPLLWEELLRVVRRVNLILHSPTADRTIVSVTARTCPKCRCWELSVPVSLPNTREQPEHQHYDAEHCRNLRLVKPKRFFPSDGSNRLLGEDEEMQLTENFVEWVAETAASHRPTKVNTRRGG
jgi:hypothetical protein